MTNEIKEAIPPVGRGPENVEMADTIIRQTIEKFLKEKNKNNLSGKDIDEIAYSLGGEFDYESGKPDEEWVLNRIINILKKMNVPFKLEEDKENKNEISILESLKEMIKKIDKDKVITEAEINSLSQIIEQKLAKKFEDGVAAGISESKEKMAEFEKQCTETLLETIDKVDTVYTNILNSLYEKCKKVLGKPIVSEKLVNRISKFLDTFLEECIDEKDVLDKDKLQRLEKFYNNVRESVLISNDEIQRVISEKLASIDQETQKLKESLNEALKSRIQLTEELNSMKKKELLDSELKNCTPEVAKRVRAFFEITPFAEIKAKLDETIKLIENEINTEHSELKQKSTKSESILEMAPVSIDKKIEQNDIMDFYVKQIQIQKVVSN